MNVRYDHCRQDNTEGYTDAELSTFNNRLNERLVFSMVQWGGDEYWEIVKNFQDKIAKS